MMTDVVQKADVVNGNGRMYPTEVFRKAVENYQRKIDLGEARGYLMPTQDSNDRAGLEPAFDVQRLDLVEGNLIGTISVLDTEPGRRLGEMLIRGDKDITLRPAGIGEVELRPDGVQVVTDYTFTSIDLFKASDAAPLVKE